MALYPCDATGHRYPGRQCSVYIRAGNGNDFDRWKLRLCAKHVTACQDDLAKFKVDPADDAIGWRGPSIECIACLKPVEEGGRLVFVTVYPANNEREDYYGLLHPACDLPASCTTYQLTLPSLPVRDATDSLPWPHVRPKTA